MELILLLGPTSSGKSDMAVILAKKLKNSVIISCDSRQVYKGLNLLSGKVEGHYDDVSNTYVYQGIKHYMIDNVKLNCDYTLDQYIKDYIKIVNDLESVQYVIVTGGTGLYARALYEQYQLNNIVINPELQSLSLAELQSKLVKSDFNNSDWNNRLRLVNKLNTTIESQKIIYPIFTKKHKYIIRVDKTIIATRVHDRIVSRIKSGMIQELENLVSQYGYDRLFRLGLESRYCSYYLLGMLTIDELIRVLDYQTMQYVKRQLTWLNKENEAMWINGIEDII
jgi:tRNA dimethylallyltransferase